MFGLELPLDARGFTHTTAREWLRAPGGAQSRHEAVRLAREARAAIEAAEKAIKEWRQQQPQELYPYARH